MTKRLTYDELMDRKDHARQKADMKAYDRTSAREDEAEKMIGELSSGKLYVYPVGGKYREGSRVELIGFLVRNNYA